MSVGDLLEVNALIGLLDDDQFITTPCSAGSAVTRAPDGQPAVTESGLIPVASHAAYPSGRRSPAEIVESLRRLKAARRKSYESGPDEIPLADQSLFSRNISLDQGRLGMPSGWVWQPNTPAL